MKVLILCGGLGTRLKSVIQDVPKSMAPVGGRPFLVYQIEWLKKFNLTDIVLAIGYKGDYIRNYFGDGSRLGVKITYSVEEGELLGTGGAIKNAESYLKDSGEEFIVLNGNTYAQIDFSKLIEFHKDNISNNPPRLNPGQGSNPKFTLGIAKVDDVSRYGSVVMDNSGKIISFIEKNNSNSTNSNSTNSNSTNSNSTNSNSTNSNSTNSNSTNFNSTSLLAANYINGGVGIFNRRILDLIPSGRPVSLEKEILSQLVNEGSLYGYVWEGKFIDMGVPESYHQLKQELLDWLMVKEDHTIRQVMMSMDKAALGIALVVDNNRKLKGLVTDGDIRRYIIKDEDLNRKIDQIMIREPVTAKVDWPTEKVKGLINPRIKHIPLLDDEGIVKDIFLSTNLDDVLNGSIIFRSQAPLRVSFSGGGTDIHSYFKDFGGCVLSTTIDKYCRGTLIKRNDTPIIIRSVDFGVDETIEDISKLNYDGQLSLVKAVIKLMAPKSGFELHLQSDVPPGSGLGSSATVAAVVASLLNQLKEEKLDEYKLSELIYKAEREELGIAGGYQDQYAAVFGGFNFMEFTDREVIVHPLRINEDIITELNHNLFLCYTGNTRFSGDIQAELVKKQDKDSSDKDEDVIKALGRLKEITLNLRSALLKGKMDEFGSLLHESWENKKRLDPRISTGTINKLYDVGIKNGALGGKILGAGGGGYLLFFCSPLKKKAVTSELEKIGGEIVNFNFDKRGVVSWQVRR